MEKNYFSTISNKAPEYHSSLDNFYVFLLRWLEELAFFRAKKVEVKFLPFLPRAWQLTGHAPELTIKIKSVKDD